jgi:hypothetical protein
MNLGYNRPLAGVTGGSPGDTAVSEILNQINVLEQDLNNNYIAYTQGRMTQDQFRKYCNDLYSKIRNINIALHSLSETLANDAGLVGEAFEGSMGLEEERGKVVPPMVIPETEEPPPVPTAPPPAQSGI